MIRQIEQNNVEINVFQQNKKGNNNCGDSYFLHTTNDYFICVVSDGLGSGDKAAECSSIVMAVTEQHHAKTVNEMMKLVNFELKNKRGAAVAIFKFYFERQELVYSCVGNIKSFVFSPSGKLTYPLPTKGYLCGKPQSYKIQNFFYDKGTKFLIHTDGLQLRSIRSFFQQFQSMNHAAYHLMNTKPSSSDDVTFLIGQIN